MPIKKRGLEEMVKSGWREVVVFSDRHTGIESAQCDAILKEYLKDNKKSVDYIIDAGDFVDNPFMSDYPVNPSFVNTAQEDFDNYSKFLREIQTINPYFEFIIIPGNHDKGRLDSKKNLNRGLASLRCLKLENVLKESLEQSKFNMKHIQIANASYELQLTEHNSILVSHGDPRLDPNVKGGLTGARRTAIEYPFNGDIIIGHGHEHKIFPRRYEGKFMIQLGGMFDIEQMKEHYINSHPYTNGFLVIKYNKNTDQRFLNYYEINNGCAMINGRLYQ